MVGPITRSKSKIRRQEPRPAGLTTPRSRSPIPEDQSPVAGPSHRDPQPQQHLPTVPAEQPVKLPEFACPQCGRSFTTKTGLGVHRRRKHVEVVNEEVNVERVRRVWSQEELRLMAREEALAIQQGVRFLNAHLLSVVPGRTIDAIKGARRGGLYKSLVQAALQDVAAVSSDSSTYLSADSSPDGESPSSSPRDLVAESPRSSRGTPSRSSGDWSALYGDLLQAIRRLLPVVDQIQGWNSQGLVALARTHIEGADVKAQIGDWIASVFPPHPPLPPRARVNIVNPGRKTRRRMDYARVQSMFRRNMSRAVRDILDGKEAEVVIPGVRSMAEHWGPFVSEPSAPVPPSAPTTPKRALAHLWVPVTCEEAASVTLPPQSSPGLDAISPRQWRAVPASIKALLFNVVMSTGGFASATLASRTVFLPKKVDSPAPADFRPISVTSVVVRHLHKILAQRLRDSNVIDLRQRCFEDGCSENIAVLASVLMEARARLREVHVASLDIAKAFDSVSHGAIEGALLRLGSPDGFRRYVSHLYDNSLTTFEVRGERSELFRVRRGVRQGDPLSPMLFCLVVDAVLGEMPPDVGFDLGGHRIGSLAFADDILLFAATKWGLQTALGMVEDKAREQGLQLNAKKCTALSIVPAGKQKKIKILSTPTFRLRNGSFIPQLTSTAEWRYLGVDFQPAGPKKVDEDLVDLLDKLSRAPLKPQQRLKALRCFLLPRLYHSLVLGRVTLGKLRCLDRQTRAAVRRWLRLPHDTATGFFHASSRDGGLGIPSLATTIPGLLSQRLARLEQSSSPSVRVAAGSAWSTRRLAWARSALTRDGDCLASAHRRNRWWAQRLHSSVDGWELRECPRSNLSSWWVDAGSLAIPGRDYVQHVHVLANCLPTLVRTSRGPRRANRQTSCRAGCNVTETAAHVIQQCHRTHGGRIKRHNAVSKTLAAGLRDAGWTVQEEPTIDTIYGKRKPDLVCVRGEEVHIVDTQIVSGASALDDAHGRKCAYYRGNDDLVAKLGTAHGVTCDRVQVSSCTVSWRGIWSSKSADWLLGMGLSRRLLRSITTRVLQGSHTNWTRWNQMTTMVPTGAAAAREGIG